MLCNIACSYKIVPCRPTPRIQLLRVTFLVRRRRRASHATSLGILKSQLICAHGDLTSRSSASIRVAGPASFDPASALCDDSSAVVSFEQLRTISALLKRWAPLCPLASDLVSASAISTTELGQPGSHGHGSCRDARQVRLPPGKLYCWPEITIIVESERGAHRVLSGVCPRQLQPMQRWPTTRVQPQSRVRLWLSPGASSTVHLRSCEVIYRPGQTVFTAVEANTNSRCIPITTLRFVCVVPSTSISNIGARPSSSWSATRAGTYSPSIPLMPSPLASKALCLPGRRNPGTITRLSIAAFVPAFFPHPFTSFVGVAAASEANIFHDLE